ncbi:hypothetical protein BDN72DRAFT_878301 [Pluteus cervinus]|uniref:Uncharacterized protein n=1 Tax=Pluteus cervinus TaxID=181527 RepID=A0ACD3AXH3_9AGAR|nr:hypothetical protein BDN72DRAFT_878301 [Pluteus cervinus]
MNHQPMHCPFLSGDFVDVQQWLHAQCSAGCPFSQPSTGVNPNDTTSYMPSSLMEGPSAHQGSSSPPQVASGSHHIPLQNVDFNSSTSSLSLSPFQIMDPTLSPAATSWEDINESATLGLEATSSWASHSPLLIPSHDLSHPYSKAYHNHHYVHDAQENASQLLSAPLPMDMIMFDDFESVAAVDSSSAHSQDQATTPHSPSPSSFRTRIGSRYMTEAGFRRRSKGQRRVYMCSIPDCGAELTSKANWRSHEKAHFNIREWQCDLCEKSFGWRHVLRRHVKTCKGITKTKL